MLLQALSESKRLGTRQCVCVKRNLEVSFVKVWLLFFLSGCASITFIFSCLVLIGWRPSAIASGRLFVLQSWKLSSIETRSWYTTEHTDYGAFLYFGGHHFHRASPWPTNSALSMLAGFSARASVLLLQFLIPDWQRRPSILVPNIPRKVEMFPNLPSFASAGGDCFSPLLAVWGCQWTSQGAETGWHSKVASSREEGDSTPGWSFCRKSLGSVCVWLRRLAHFREKLQSPCKNCLKNAQIENILEGQKHLSLKKKVKKKIKKQKKDKGFFF